jgi:RHS repeat-associated protein
VDGRLIQNDSLPSLATDLAWDAADRITEIADASGSQQFGYDLLDRLTGAAGPWGSQGFAYDGVGNRTAKTDAVGTTSYNYGATSHRLDSEIGPLTRTHQYDAAGNLAGDGSLTYSHDGRGRLVRVEQGGMPVATYAHDAFGWRVKKQTPAEGERHYAYDPAGRLLGEYDAQGNALREYVWLDDLPVAVLDPPVTAPQTGTLRYVHADHLGTPRRISDPATGQVIWSWGGAPFGESAADEDPDGDGIPYRFDLRFPGQYLDAETGRHYNVFRDYDPRLGRYVQSDPIGLEGGINTYAYSNDSPTMYVDPLGLSAGAITVPVPGGGTTGAGGTLSGLVRICGKLLPAWLVMAMSPSEISGCQDFPPPSECKNDQPCDPPEGTQCYEGPDYGKPHAGLSPHYHIYQMQKKRPDGICFWRYLGGKVGVGVVGVPPAGMCPCSTYPNFTGRGS